MKTASITEAKNNLSALIDGLRGGSVLILDRGRPVARLESVRMGRPEEAGQRLAELARQGIVTLPKRPLTPEFFERPLPKLPEGVSVLKALLDEREEGL
ncbi:MAG TPA: type II toxin-antitoxin system Phd/YefM family antitoxin [Terriglobales bacterium]|nr:type II toxin-antitoxin system Phd/YefM family antitoxin [Terriglobales bacterium]